MATEPRSIAHTREQQRQEWTAAAPGWRRRAARTDQAGAPLNPYSAVLLRLARISPGQRVLDLSCGLGEPALLIAERVDPGGSVLGLDITAAMVEGARQRAQQRGITNVVFRGIPSELDLGEPAATYDAATCRNGLMYMPDPVAALAALRVTLKPGGRVAVSTLGPRDRCPFLTLPLTIMSRHTTLPTPDPSAPGPFALPSPDTLASVLTAAGYTQVETEVHEAPQYAEASAEACWDTITTNAGPLLALLTPLSEATRQAIHDDAIATLARLFPAGPVSLTSSAIIAGATNPG
jgi:ubiquinone/menaquinone biosynthesis C-methylase UbiE